jgi:hypothetical protein
VSRRICVNVVEVQAPLIHLNGSDGSLLAKHLSVAVDALRLAVVALGDVTPNERDYYPDGDDAWRRAQEGHERRVAHVATAWHEARAILRSVDDQITERNKTRSTR